MRLLHDLLFVEQGNSFFVKIFLLAVSQGQAAGPIDLRVVPHHSEIACQIMCSI
jgi:hypothetical protein